MTLKEMLYLNNLIQKIKLDKSEKVKTTYLERELSSEEKNDVEYINSSEWNQEYELIYLSYVLEK